MQVTSQYVVLRPNKAQDTKTASGLITLQKDQPCIGVVHESGEGQPLAKGKVVVFNIRRQVKFNWNGEEFTAIPHEDVIAILD